MKNSILFKIFIVAVLLVIFSSCKTTDNNSYISETQKSELEEFLSIFTIKPVLSNYTQEEEHALLYFTVYHLVELGDDRVKYDKQKNEYIVPKLAVDEKIEEYFGVEVDFSPYLGSTIRLKNEEYHFDDYFQSGAGYTKIESVTKQGDEFFLTCYTTNSNGRRNNRPKEPVDGGPVLYNFTALVAPHEYNGEKTWKLVELQQIE